MILISPKMLINMARKWQRIAALSRKRISFPRINYMVMESSTTSSNVISKGHFVVYTTDDKRFVMPLEYLNQNILRELFKMSEEEFGLSSDAPIRLPCDAVFMEYVVKLIRRGVAKDLEKALLRSIDTSFCYSSLSAPSFHTTGQFTSQQIPVFGY
ncbi:auxin-responsive protein SAUR68-like [Humulus lupulus]|uniref:auxin-responsive protein SAUR68-like n=1 Tax=Humulus lupulus TaxID=3486 RepID=UPI002B40E646|nr:auxin-responsive protein SAUR68-like [Humulus lupulus]